MVITHRKYPLINWIRKIKKRISQTPSGAKIAYQFQKTIFNILFRDKERLFTYYYKTNKWGNQESLSGPGSSLAATLNIRRQLPKLIEDLKINRLLDAPCGDFHWFKLVKIPSDTDYIGGDIVKEAIESNKNQYSKPNVKFIHIDIINDTLPIADLWLCRDTLFHFSNDDILKVLANLKKSKIHYLLTTTFPDIVYNQDIVTGEYRPINLEMDPFKLPCPQQYIDDSDDGHQGKKLGLWKLL
ncbi:MAG: class I SAM-dependent methyltransferase [Mariniphaga sp.]